MPVGLLGVSLVVPIVFLPALFAFHDISLHRAAVSDWSFHPVHTAYVYG